MEMCWQHVIKHVIKIMDRLVIDVLGKSTEISDLDGEWRRRNHQEKFAGFSV